MINHHALLKEIHLPINFISSFEKTNTAYQLSSLFCHVKLPYAMPHGSTNTLNGAKHYFESNPFCLLLNVIKSQILKCPKSYFLLKHQPFLGHTNMKYTTIFDQPISFRTYLWQEV